MGAGERSRQPRSSSRQGQPASLQQQQDAGPAGSPAAAAAAGGRAAAGRAAGSPAAAGRATAGRIAAGREAAGRGVDLASSWHCCSCR
uniref:Uncharacterized protein n=1 Tax=Tetradesmus obliquus TaxID=3088 RepID=A0A383WJA6_TETOB